MLNENITLIGMPASGKSTIGVLLAKTLGLSFIDTDLLIQEREERLLQEIVDSDGINRFIKIEESIIVDLNLNIGRQVIATGGSVVYSDISMAFLQNNSKIIYLQTEYDEIKARLSNITSRGIAIKKGKSLLELYKERIPLYERYAEYTINCSGKQIEDIVTEVKNAL